MGEKRTEKRRRDGRKGNWSGGEGRAEAGKGGCRGEGRRAEGERYWSFQLK